MIWVHACPIVKVSCFKYLRKYLFPFWYNHPQILLDWKKISLDNLEVFEAIHKHWNLANTDQIEIQTHVYKLSIQFSGNCEFHLRVFNGLRWRRGWGRFGGLHFLLHFFLWFPCAMYWLLLLFDEGPSSPFLLFLGFSERLQEICVLIGVFFRSQGFWGGWRLDRGLTTISITRHTNRFSFLYK